MEMMNGMKFDLSSVIKDLISDKNTLKQVLRKNFLLNNNYYHRLLLKTNKWTK